MGKLWLMAKEEYSKRVSERSFLIGTLAIPLVFTLIIAVTIIVIEQNDDNRPFGYVDYSGFLENTSGQKATDNTVEIRAFPSEASAREALRAGDIQGFHVIPADYLGTLKVDLYYLDERPEREVLVDFDDFVRTTLTKVGISDIQTRIIEGVDLTVRSVDGRRTFQEGAGFLTVLFPLAVGLFFTFAVMGASGYFLQAVTDEKENRTVELMLTSLSPLQFIGGKSLGLLAVVLSQIGIWLLTIAVGWMIAVRLVDELQGILLPWNVLVVFALFFVPALALVASLMIAIGSAVTEHQEGQQISGVISLFFTFPLFLSVVVFANPDHPIIVALSFWPTTSLLMVMIRWGFTIIPIWQLALSWAILVGSAATGIWLAAKIFQMGFLRYGQRLTLKSILRKVSPGAYS